MNGRLSILPAAAASDTAVNAPMYRLLGVLAAYADKSGQCFPSVALLAGDLHASERWVRELLGVLATTPYLSIEHRPGRSSLYQINGVSPDFTPEPGVHPCTESSPTPEAGVHPPLKQGFTHKDTPKDTPKDTWANDQFDKFWKTYPSRGENNTNPKKPARAKFLAAVKRGVDPAIIINGAANFAAAAQAKGTEPQYIPQALKWLKQDRWEDHQTTPSVGRKESDPQPRSMKAI